MKITPLIVSFFDFTKSRQLFGRCDCQWRGLPLAVRNNHSRESTGDNKTLLLLCFQTVNAEDRKGQVVPSVKSADTCEAHESA
ncbi:MAG TPA: hypothetical protein ENI74_00995 [Gammaproteobacteria bacterium]|nr:hypothetical protein [Gammaproteobacteria bacterium]